MLQLLRSPWYLDVLEACQEPACTRCWFLTMLATAFKSTLCVEASILWPRVFHCHFSEECHIFHSRPGKLTMARFIRIDFRSTMWYRRNISGFSASSSRSNLLLPSLPVFLSTIFPKHSSHVSGVGPTCSVHARHPSGLYIHASISTHIFVHAQKSRLTLRMTTHA